MDTIDELVRDDNAKELAHQLRVAQARIEALGELNELAWGIIANAGGGDWTTQTKMWQDAAARWRDRYHAALASPPEGAP